MALYYTGEDANNYDNNIQLIEPAEAVIGGIDGVDNRALKQLSDRTGYLKKYKSNILKGSGEPDANTADDLTLDANSINAVFYIDEDTETIYKLANYSPVTWTNVSKDAIKNIKGVKINKNGNINTFISIQYNTSANRLEFVDQDGNLANVKIGKVEYETADGLTLTQSQMVDDELLILFEITQESENRDGTFAVKRLSDISTGTISTVEIEKNLYGVIDSTQDRWTTSTDLTPDLSAGDYFQVRNIDEDTGEVINGYYKINTINTTHITTSRSFNSVDGTNKTGQTGNLSKDNSVFLQWNNSSSRFDLIDRSGSLLPLNISSLNINGVPIGGTNFADIIISTQGEFNQYFEKDTGDIVKELDITNTNIYIKPETTNNYYELSNKVYIKGSNGRIISMSGTEIKYTSIDAGIYMYDDSGLAVDSYLSDRFIILSEDTQRKNTDFDNYEEQIVPIVGDILYGFSKDPITNKQYTIGIINKSIKDEIDIDPDGTGSTDNLNLEIGSSKYHSHDFTYNNNTYIAITYEDGSNNISNKVYLFDDTTNNYIEAASNTNIFDGDPTYTTTGIRTTSDDTYFYVVFGTASSMRIGVITLADIVAGSNATNNREVITGNGQDQLSIAVNSDIIYIASRRISTNNLVYLKIPSNGTGTIVEQIFNQGQIGFETDLTNNIQTGIAVNSSGQVLITYNDNDTSTGYSKGLNLVYYSGSGWTRNILDDASADDGDCGYYSVVRQNINGSQTGETEFYVAYNYDSTKDRIKFAGIDISSTPILNGTVTLITDSLASFDAIDYRINYENQFPSNTNELHQVIAWDSNNTGSTGDYGLYTFISTDNGSNWQSDQINLIEHDNTGFIANLKNNYLFVAYYNGTTQSGNYDNKNYLLKLYYTIDIYPDETIPTMGLTDIVLSPNFNDKIRLDLEIDANNQGSDTGSSEDCVNISNTVNSEMRLIIQKSLHDNGINGNNKVYNIMLSPSIDTDSSTINNIKSVNHSTMLNVNLAKSNITVSNFTDCQNYVAVGLINKFAEGGSSFKTRNITYSDSPFNADQDTVVLADTTTGNIIVNLPQTAAKQNKVYYIKNIGTGVVTIAGQTGELIDGSTTKNINAQYNTLSVVSDGNHWFLI